jgi:hypothetical protein
MDKERVPFIQRTGKIPLNAMETRVLQTMFQEYERIAVEHEFGAGYSGCRVFRVRAIEAGGEADRPELVKIGPVGLINEEWRAYDSLVRPSLPRIAWVTSPPMLAPESGWGGMRYELVGEGMFEVQSLSQYYHHAGTEDLLFVLQKRLFRVLGHTWWLANRPESAFQFQSDYDHLLPVNLRISATGPLPDSAVQLVTPFNHNDVAIEIGARVRLQGFVVTEIEGDSGLTLNHPAALADRPFDAFRLRIEGVTDAASFQVGEIVESLHGVVIATRHSLLIDYSRRALGEYVDLQARSFKLPEDVGVSNPLLAYQELLSKFFEVSLSRIHGDLNLENVLIDPETRDVKLIDFATVRYGHNLHDLLRLETGLVTSLLPQTLAEAGLPAQTIVPLYRQLDRGVFRGEPACPDSLLHPLLEKPFAILRAIREEARKCMYNPEEPAEYYVGLSLYLLGALKFKSLDQVASAKAIAFLGSGAAIDLSRLRRGEEVVQPVAEAPPVPAPEPATSGPPARRVSWRRGVLLLLLAFLALVAAAVIFWPSDAVPIAHLCEIEEAYVVEIVEGPARGATLLDFFKLGNRELFEYIGELEQAYRAGEAHRGITYVWGPPAVGKSFVTRQLDDVFPEDSCLVEIRELLGEDAEQLGFSITTRPDLVTLDGQVAFDSLPSVEPINDFELESLLQASGCRKDGRLVSMVILDALDEVGKETSEAILRAIDQLMLDVEGSDKPYIHVFVFGRPEGFAPWYQDPRRTEAVMEILHVFTLGGPYMQTSGDLVVFAEDEVPFIVGRETWEAMQDTGEANRRIADYVEYIRSHSILPYSIRSLALAGAIVDRSTFHPEDSEAELKSFLFDELLRRANETHGRPLASDDQYVRLLEEIAVVYGAEERIDEKGFFDVGANETVAVRDGNGQIVGDVLVRDVLDHSGIAFLNPASYASPRYQFYPIWLHSHLVEMYNQRLDADHRTRTCNE